MVRKPTAIVTLTLRLREDLRRKIEREAAKREHSLNIEIVERLEASFVGDQIMASAERSNATIRADIKKFTDLATSLMERLDKEDTKPK